MVYLPQEILERVAFYANGETRRSLLTVSRPLQAAVEKLTWGGSFQLRSSNIDRFLQRYHGDRLSLCTCNSNCLRFVNEFSDLWDKVRKVVFSVEFPPLYEKRRVINLYPWEVDEPEEEYPRIPCRQSKEELQADDELFNQQIHELFTALKTIEDRIASFTTPNRAISLSIKSPFQKVHEIAECDHRRYSSWRLHLLNLESLPIISIVQTLIIGEESQFLWQLCDRPETAKYIHERLNYPYPDEVNMHYSRSWEGLRRDTRHDFLISVPELPHPTLKHFTMRCGLIDQLLCLDQRAPIPDLVRPLGYDPLSSALRVSSQQLTSLELMVYADTGLFWPASEDPITTPPSWPHLKHLSVLFHPASPSGSWYLEGPRGEGRYDVGHEVTGSHYPPLGWNIDDETWDEDWARIDTYSPDMFRTEPNNSSIEPLLEAFAKALGEMPVLEDAELFTCVCLERDYTKQYHIWLLEKERMFKGRLYDRPKDPGTIRSSEEARAYKWGVKYFRGANVRLEWWVSEWRPSAALVKQFSRVLPEEYWVYI